MTKTTNINDIFDAYDELDFLDDDSKEDNVNAIFENSKAPSLEEELMFLDDLDFSHDFNEDEMDKTKDINLFKDEKLKKALEAINGQIEEKVKEEPKVLKKTKKPTSLEAAFVNCSILGFITLFSGFGWLFWIVGKIAG